MLNYIQALNVPVKVAAILIGLFFVLQAVGEILEFKGKVVPEFVKVRKYFARKKQERAMMDSAMATLDEVKTTIKEFNAHYSADNIRMRDEWIKGVNEKLDRHDEWVQEFTKKLDKNNADTLSLLIDSKRNTIINFAACVIDEHNPVTREQFNRIFKLYEEYEAIITSNGLTNGEVDVAYRIISEAYETHMRNHSFVEDIRGYTSQS